jgi:competence protein ComFC
MPPAENSNFIKIINDSLFFYYQYIILKLHLMSLLDLIYPKRCVGCGSSREYLCPTCFSYLVFIDGGFCVVCQRPAIGGFTHPVCKTKYEIDGVFASVVYAGVVKRLVYKFKYNTYLLDIKHLLIDLFYEGLIQKEPFMRLLSDKNIFTPIPLHKKRMRERGYNQSRVLAAGLAKRLENERKIDLVESLKRVRQTRPQFGLSQKDRLTNVQGAFELRQIFAKDLLNAPVVFLIDDIVTTGATFRETASILKKAGVGKVYGLAFAHGE